MLKKKLLSVLFFLWIISPVVSQTITSVGTDFWVAFPPNLGTANIELHISSAVATSGSVYSAYPGVNQNFTVIPGVVTQLTLPSDVVLQSGVENKGIRITSVDPITVYGLNHKTLSSDAFLALPVNALGLDYTVMTYSNTVSTGSCFSVVATQDGTTLTAYNHQANTTTNVNLNTGETYFVKATNLNDDLTGSRIQSNFPVAVFGSVTCVYIPAGCISCDHIVEEMFPHHSWGKNFVTVPLAGRDASGDVFRVLAAEDGTTVTVNGVLDATINTGDHYEAILTGYNSISTNHASFLAQFAKGQGCSGNNGDPFMLIIPPEEQFLTSYTVVNVAGFTSHWVNIIAPSNAISLIYQDGVLIPSSAFTQIGITGFYGAQRSVTQGSHTFNSTFPFGVFIYGWNYMDSYGYTGGCSLSPVGTVNSVTLSPLTATGQLNVSSVCLTANVLDNLSNPVAGVLVNFHVSGINPLSGNAYTDASGNAVYCYTQTGTTPGTDNVYGDCFGYNSNTSVVTWTYTPPCTNPDYGGVIGNDQSGCSSYTPATLDNLTSPTGQTGTLEYKWQQSIVSSSSGFTDIAGSNSASFNPVAITQTTWYKRLARVDCMQDWTGAVASNVLVATVIDPLPVSLSILASDNNVCAGTLITFTAAATNGGSTPVYQWKVNGTNAGANNSSYSYTPINGDIITCVLTSNALCPSGNPATSNSLTMTVNPNLPVSIAVSPSANPFCSGTAVTFTATPTNGGGLPSYQWKVNGGNAGSNNSTFTYNPVNGDLVSCTLNSNLPCTLNNPTTSSIIMISLPAPAVSFTLCFDSITILSAAPLQLKGGIPVGGTYSGQGVSSGGFTPSIAGVGVKTISYTYTNMYTCSSLMTRTIKVLAVPSFSCGQSLTDIRDNTVYPTIQLGSQCWMQKNLNYGNSIQGAIEQTDNCINEKYCYNDNAANCSLYGGLYLWDEMMAYTNTPGAQGLCPPGWHIPTQSEWNTLFTLYQNQALAGKPLQDSIFNGFRAKESGIVYSNISWKFEGFATVYWTSNPYGVIKALSHGMNMQNFSVSDYYSNRSNAFAVRCLRD